MNHERHSNIFDVRRLSVTLIGTGGIGAATAICLSKMGISELHIYDDDDVSDENLPTQLFPIDSLGKHKVVATKDLVEMFSDETIVLPNYGRVTETSNIKNNIIISAVDSITSRKKIWEAIVQKPFIYYLDARMGAEVFQLYAVSPEDRWWYDEMIKEQREESVPDLPCTAKATIYTAFIAAGHIGFAIRQLSQGHPLPPMINHNIAAQEFMRV